MRPTRIKGRIWVLKNEQGRMIHDIDTDQIYHNKHLAITDISEMGKYALGNLKGWEDFPQKARQGDIIFAGKNFGAGSSRQHAVDCFKALGIAAIVADSFGAIYKRNAINSGFAIVEFAGLSELAEQREFENGHEVEINFETGEIKNLTTGKSYKAKPFSKVQMDIYQAGNLFAYGRQLEGK